MHTMLNVDADPMHSDPGDIGRCIGRRQAGGGRWQAL